MFAHGRIPLLWENRLLRRMILGYQKLFQSFQEFLAMRGHVGLFQFGQIANQVLLLRIEFLRDVDIDLDQQVTDRSVSRMGIPRRRIEKTSPDWVPLGISIGSGPSSVGTSSVAPSAA